MALDARAEWPESTYLLARVSDSLELSNYFFIKANAENSDGIDVPAPIARPGEPEPIPDPAPQDFSSPEELFVFFGQMNNL
ncbi:hypothetical protein ACIOEX_20035 [Streptomyces sp. NPDC087850]|uniref:hypothetical protein n=1 Tax=Streptomyces sp. NPDC087850 TaxID=3365809 RepID=UPI0038101E9C